MTDNGKDTLSGFYCPKIFCNVTKLLHLWWRYNSNRKIYDFQPDNFDLILTNVTPFPFIQLTQFNAYKIQNNRLVFNVSSVLTADLSELYKQNIETVSCGSSIPIRRQYLWISASCSHPLHLLVPRFIQVWWYSMSLDMYL